MKFKMNKTDLLTLLQKALPFVKRKPTIPIIANFLLDATGDKLTVTGTDLDNSLRLAVSAKVMAEGRCTIPARKLIDILKTLKTAEAADVTVQAEIPEKPKTGRDDAATCYIHLQCGELKVKILGMKAVNYPTLPTFPAVTSFTVPGDVLNGLIERTTYAIAQQEYRYALIAALFIAKADCVSMVTTDGHRLANVKRFGTYGVNEEFRTLIGSKALALLKGLVDDVHVEITKNESTLFFRCGDWTMTSRIVTGQFPNYEDAIPKDCTKEVVFVSAKLKEVLSRVAMFADERSRAVKFNLEPDKGLTISASSTELGEASECIAVPYTGEAVSIGFNAEYISDILGTLNKHDQIAMKVKDGNSAAMFVPVAGEFQSQNIVMPMRLAATLSTKECQNPRAVPPEPPAPEMEMDA